MSFYRPLQDEDKNFKLKQTIGQQYNTTNGSSGTWSNPGFSRRTGSFRLWIGFACSVNVTSTIDVGNRMSVPQNLLYNSLNSLIKKYTGSYRNTTSQPTFYRVIFDKRAFQDYVNISREDRFITTSTNTLIKKPATRLNDARVYNQESYQPIIDSVTEDQVGYLFPWQGVYVHFNQSIVPSGQTNIYWQPIRYKQNAYYFCRANSGGFNFSNNASFTAGSSSRAYITTIGLYGQRTQADLGAVSSPLLAVAKVALPVRKSDEIEYIFKINLEF